MSDAIYIIMNSGGDTLTVNHQKWEQIQSFAEKVWEVVAVFENIEAMKKMAITDEAKIMLVDTLIERYFKRAEEMY